MADLHFSQPERRNLALPILLALLALALAAGLVLRLTPRATAELTITRVDLFPAHTVFKSETNVVGSDQVQDDLYALVTVRLTDRLRLPLFLKDVTATLTPANASPQPATSAVEHADLKNLYTRFPALGRLAATEPAPLLLRETRVDPGQTVEGFVIVHFPITPAAWQSRSNAVLTLDLYHQAPLSVSLPKDAPALPGSSVRPPAHPPTL